MISHTLLSVLLISRLSPPLSFPSHFWRKLFPVISDFQEALPIVWCELRDVGRGGWRLCSIRVIMWRHGRLFACRLAWTRQRAYSECLFLMHDVFYREASVMSFSPTEEKTEWDKVRGGQEVRECGVFILKATLILLPYMVLLALCCSCRSSHACFVPHVRLRTQWKLLAVCGDGHVAK